jgi:hypothetical protein
MAAIEAAVLCHRIGSQDDFGTPQWLSRGDHPNAAEILIRSIAGAYGIEL